MAYHGDYGSNNDDWEDSQGLQKTHTDVNAMKLSVDMNDYIVEDTTHHENRNNDNDYDDEESVHK